MGHDHHDRDSPEAIAICRRTIDQKPFLRALYQDFYDVFINQARQLAALQGKMVELGSGGGFLKKLLPEVVTSDVCAAPAIDQVISAEHLPFEDRSLKALFLMNVLHHVPDVEMFFREAERCLVPGGRIVMIEPHRSVWSQLFYKHLHYEAWDDRATDWKLPEGGRISRANNALPWIIFWRDRSRFEKSFPHLKILERHPHTATRYLVSGGLTYPAMVPAFSYPFFRWLDGLLDHVPTLFPIYQTVVLEKVA